MITQIRMKQLDLTIISTITSIIFQSTLWAKDPLGKKQKCNHYDFGE